MFYYFIIYLSIAILCLTVIKMIHTNGQQSESYLIQKFKKLFKLPTKLLQSDLLLISTSVSGVLTALSLLLGAPIFVGLILFAIAASITYGILIKKRRNAEMVEFDKNLIDALSIISASLRSGATLPEALTHSCDGLGEVYTNQIQQALNKFHLGVSLDLCLEVIEKNMPTRAASMVINSLIISWQSGGNLPEVLDQIAVTVRERFRVEGKLKALTAQGRTQANILCVAPFVICALMAVIDPARIQLLFTTTVGKIVVVASISLVMAGYVVTQKMLKLEV